MKNNFQYNDVSGEGELRILALALVMIMFLAEASNVQASNHRGDLGTYHGVWIGNSVTAEKQPRGFLVMARDLDVAVRKTKTDFDMTWSSLSQERARRMRAHFVATSEPDVFAAKSIEPPLAGKEKLWAQMEGRRLVVYLSRLGSDGAERLARYELSVSNGRMTFGYTLLQGDEVLESVKGHLSRAKVVF